jgi:XTP/dITP diphosphohydrolase
MKPLIFCTHNQHKLQEVAQILGNDLQFVTLTEVGFMDEIPEPFHTLSENALQKTQTVYNHLQQNCFSEDTGLFVQALAGEPGVFSARYAGEKATAQDNIQKLLKNLAGKTDRSAYFKTVISLIWDPIFVPEGYVVSFAQLPASKKNEISHRRKAMDALSLFLSTMNP